VVLEFEEENHITTIVQIVGMNFFLTSKLVVATGSIACGAGT
jgi:hypothetical protein